MKILYTVTTSPTAVCFLKGQLAFLRSKGHDVTLVASDEEGLLQAFADQEGIAWQSLPMTRSIHPLRDLCTLLALARLMRKLRPDAVNFGTPKASLLCSLAAWMMRIPRRVYTVHGLRFETTQGLLRSLLRSCESMICRLSTDILCVSPSLLHMLSDNVPHARNRMRILAEGSCNGLDVEALQACMVPGDRERIRVSLGIPPEAPVIGFVGRIAHDKGLDDLVPAFLQVLQQQPCAHLLLVGPEDRSDPVTGDTRRLFDHHPAIHWVGPQANPVPFYASMDLFALPTHREGLGYSALEAAALGLPVLATTATGVKDAVQDGISGWLVPPGNPGLLAAKLEEVMAVRENWTHLGAQGRSHVLKTYPPQRVWTFMHDTLTGHPS